ncbi:MAG TPA: hypothetical protein VFL95_04395, partial [Gemmatimonadales bacterium]|nr:hypothetical protein [Gemmatimonadales bacterium]
MTPRAVLLLAGLGLLPCALAGQQPSTNDSFPLTIPSIMRGPEIVGRAPAGVRWSADGKWIYFAWDPPGTDWREPLHDYRIRARAGAQPERLTPAAADSSGPFAARGDVSPDGKLKVVEYHDDLYLIDLRHDRAQRITRSAESESSPHFSADGKSVLYRRDSDAWERELATGLDRQLTAFHAGKAPHDSTPHGQRGFLVAQQKQLFQVIRDQDRQDSVRKAQREDDLARLGVQPAWLGGARDERVAGLAIAPDARHVMITARTRAKGSRATEVPEYVTESGYTSADSGRTKVGDVQGRARLGLFRVGDDSVHWINPLEDDSGHHARIGLLGWNDAGTMALVSVTSPDFKTHLMATIDTAGTLHRIERLRDSAWVGGPCFGCGGWL